MLAILSRLLSFSVQNRWAVPPLSRNLRVSPDRGAEVADGPGFPVGEPDRPHGESGELLSSVAYVCGSWA